MQSEVLNLFQVGCTPALCSTSGSSCSIRRPIVDHRCKADSPLNLIPKSATVPALLEASPESDSQRLTLVALASLRRDLDWATWDRSPSAPETTWSRVVWEPKQECAA